MVISSEGDPRTAAFIQSDLQLAMPNARVIVARPEMFDRNVVLQIYADLPHITDSGDKVKAVVESPAFNQALTSVMRSRRLVSDLTGFDLDGSGAQAMRAYATLIILGLLQLVPPEKRGESLNDVIGISAEADALVGICGIPLYNFSEADIETINKGSDLDPIRNLLKKLNTLQYFLPSPGSACAWTY